MKAGWEVRPLGEECEITMGTSPPGDTYNTTGNGTPLINGPVEFGPGAFGLTVKTKFTTAPNKMCQKGDLILCVRGSTTGKTNVAGFDACVGRGVAAVRAKQFQPWVNYFIHWKTSAIFALGTGSTFPNITAPALAAIPIPVPPLPEQRRIVAILDEAFEGIAAAKANAERNLRNAREVFESRLTLLFTQEEQRWPNRRLAEVCGEITVGHVGSMKGEYREDGIPFLRSQNIRPFEVTLENIVYISDRFHRSLRKSTLRPGDLAIVRTGYPGTTAVIPESLPEANCSDLVIMRAGNEAEPSYIAAFLNSSYGRRLVASQLVGAAQKHFNVTAAKQVVLRIPPRSEQVSVVNSVMQLRDQVQACEAIIMRKLAALDELKASLLHQAFTSQL